MEEQWTEQEEQIERYRILQREVTDPLAAGLLHCIIEELEAGLAEHLAHWDPTSCE